MCKKQTRTQIQIHLQIRIRLVRVSTFMTAAQIKHFLSPNYYSPKIKCEEQTASSSSSKKIVCKFYDLYLFRGRIYLSRDLRIYRKQEYLFTIQSCVFLHQLFCYIYLQVNTQLMLERYL